MAKPNGEIRLSQLISTYGPGALTDLPDYSVLISGLSFWRQDGQRVISEPRLAAKISRLFNGRHIELRTPPLPGDALRGETTGVPAFRFPQWFVTQEAPSDNSQQSRRTRFLVHEDQLVQNRFRDPDSRRNLTVIPIRFVRGCRRGHVADINWYEFVHRGDRTCQNARRQLFFDETGTSGDLAEVSIRCECKRARPMSDVATQRAEGLGHCDGARPWLGPASREICTEQNRLLIRTASNAYFGQRLTVISLPDRSATISAAVDQAWDFIEEADSPNYIAQERRKSRVAERLAGVTDDEVWAEIQTRRGQIPRTDRSVKRVELETLTSPMPDYDDEEPDGTFYARTLPEPRWNDKPWMQGIERVVLVQRLREVSALVGFTRFEPMGPDTEGELDIQVHRADLDTEITWVPAAENLGEGIFIQFDRAAVDAWVVSEAVQSRDIQLRVGFSRWSQEAGTTRRAYAGARYIMLHTFAHILMTRIALDCGYPASSIRERIYSFPDLGYGVLLYTGSSDAEGTLGGLIEVGKRISQTIGRALVESALCSNDPICAQHDPHTQNEHNFLLGAACHGCVLVAETSCEQQNDFLDRALVGPTVATSSAGFFTPGGL